MQTSCANEWNVFTNHLQQIDFYLQDKSNISYETLQNIENGKDYLARYKAQQISIAWANQIYLSSKNNGSINDNLKAYFNFENHNIFIGSNPDYQCPQYYLFPRYSKCGDCSPFMNDYSLQSFEHAKIFLFRPSLAEQYLKLLKNIQQSPIHADIISSVTLLEEATTSLLSHKNLSEEHRTLVAGIQEQCKKIIGLNNNQRCEYTLSKLPDVFKKHDLEPSEEAQALEPRALEPQVDKYPDNQNKFDYLNELIDYNNCKIDIKFNSLLLKLLIILLNIITLGLINLLGLKKEMPDSFRMGR